MPALAARASERYLEDFRGKLSDLALTYHEVGATVGALPKGYRHDRAPTNDIS